MLHRVLKIAADQVRFSWDTTWLDGSSLCDQVMIVAYNIESKEVEFQLTGQFRKTGSDTLEIDFDRYPGTYHLCIAFIAADRSCQSHSVYLGTIEFGGTSDEQAPPTDDEHVTPSIDIPSVEGSDEVDDPVSNEVAKEDKEPVNQQQVFAYSMVFKTSRTSIVNSSQVADHHADGSIQWIFYKSKLLAWRSLISSDACGRMDRSLSGSDHSLNFNSFGINFKARAYWWSHDNKKNLLY